MVLIQFKQTYHQHVIVDVGLQLSPIVKEQVIFVELEKGEHDSQLVNSDLIQQLFALKEGISLDFLPVSSWIGPDEHKFNASDCVECEV